MGIGEILAGCDLLDKLDGLVRGLYFTARGRGSARIEFTPPSGSSAGDMERILWRYKIPVYGRALAGKVQAEGRELPKFAVRTTQTQRSWAEYVLLRAGATVWTLADPRNVQWAAQYQAPPPAWAEVHAQHPAQPARLPGKPKGRGSARVARALRELW